MLIQEFIQRLPKAELHLHIEGSLEPELLFIIAKRNNIDIPYKSIEELKKAYNFSCLQDFLNIYYQGASVLQTEQDFYDLTYAYFVKCKEENIRHTEIMFDPQTHTNRGINFSFVINGIYRACEDAKERFDITSFLIMSYLRHLSEADAFITLKQSLPYKNKIKAVGLDSSEQGNPPSKFKKVFEASIKEGYIPVAHAGEEGNADYIWEALDILKIKRIDHGNNCLQDLQLINKIKELDLSLTICPLSNKELKVVPNLNNHPLKKMLEKGLKPTINSDDPAYFGGQINQNFIEIQEALDLTKKELFELSRNSFEYSFLDKAMKAKYIVELEEFYRINK